MNIGGIEVAGHLPVLQVVIPLLAAPICVLLRRADLLWGFALLVSAVTLAIAACLSYIVLTHGVVSYSLGGWAPPWGIEYRIDALNALVLVVITAVSTVTLISARESLETEIGESRCALVYALWMLCLTGLLGVVATGDVFNVFVFLEISSLSTYVLIALGPERRALLAAFRYLIMGTVGATFFLIGIGLLYVQTGTLNMLDIADRLPVVADAGVSLAALAFIIIGVGLKAALFPLHAWLPDAYSTAPASITAFIAGSATKVSIYVLARFLYSIFGAEAVFVDLAIGGILVPLALTGALVASTVAIFQDDLKRLLAWSSIAQAGYMLLGLALASVNSVTGALVHVFNHALLKTALFLVVGNIVYRIGTSSLDSLSGLGQRMPWTMAAFVIAGLGLIGVPLTTGFISKWYLVAGAFDAEHTVAAMGLIASSLLSVVYLARVVRVVYFVQPLADSLQARVEEAPLVMLIPLALLVVASLWFGIAPGFGLALAADAAATLLMGLP